MFEFEHVIITIIIAIAIIFSFSRRYNFSRGGFIHGPFFEEEITISNNSRWVQ